MTQEPATVEIIEQTRRFEALGHEWGRLLHSSATANPFLTWEWLFAWWTHLRGSSQLKIFTVRVAGELIAIAPFRVTRDRLSWFWSLQFLGTGHAGSDYLDLIARKGYENEAVEVLADAIEAEGLALQLTHLPPNSLASRLAQQLRGRGWTHRENKSGTCPLIHLAGHTFDSYLATRGAAHRANVRRRLRAAARRFDVRFEQVAADSQRLEVLGALEAFHNARWRGRRGSTTFRSAELQQFHRDVTRATLRANQLRLYGLYLDRHLAGAMYAFSYHNRFYFYQHGFDQQFSEFSPGLLLMGLTIGAAIEEGAIEFDLLYGAESYKWLWANDQRQLGRLDLYPAQLGGRLQQRGADAEMLLRAFARRLHLRPRHV